MNKKPLISILIPAYNAGSYLSQCLDSIIKQTYFNLQIVVFDDGSKDNTWEICVDYLKRDIRIEIYHHENSGVAATRNILLDKVKGDYFLFVDADDWIESDMIEAMFQLALEYNVDIVNCQFVKNDAICKKNLNETDIWSQGQTIYHFLRHTIFNGSLCNKLIRTSLIHNLKFHNDISYGEDALFCWQVLQRIKTVVRTPNEYYHYRMNDTSLSHQSWTPEKKGSGSIVWRIITENTAKLWPQYLDLAKARYAIEDMWGLYFASLAKYPYDKHIKERQFNVRRNLRLIRKSGLVSMNKILTSYALAYCYGLGRLLKFTRK